MTKLFLSYIYLTQIVWASIECSFGALCWPRQRPFT
eukprot:UN14238